MYGFAYVGYYVQEACGSREGTVFEGEKSGLHINTLFTHSNIFCIRLFLQPKVRVS